MASSSDRASARAARFWVKLGSWYGASVLQQNYGESPPADWAEVIDHHSDANIRSALAEVRVEHTRYPPTLPEFEKILRKVSGPKIISRAPRPQDLLTQHILRHATLTPQQLRGPWHFFGRAYAAKNPRGEMVEGHGIEIVGVQIDADGDSPAIRVLLSDIQAQQLAAEFADAPATPPKHFAQHLPQLPDFGPRENRDD